MAKLLYIVIQDGAGGTLVKGKTNISSSFRYTRPILQSTLQLIGCKPRHAFKISQRVFEILREVFPIKALESNGSDSHEFSRHLSDSEIDSNREYSPEELKKTAEDNELQLKEINKKLYDMQKKWSTVVLSREEFMDVVCNAMSEYRYVGPNQRSDFFLASRIREKKTSVTILLCGTSGCGKSTLSTLLASRLGITTVVSTDSIRHMMRSFASEKENPLLYASTYSAGEHLDPVAVAEAKAKKLAKTSGRIMGYSSAEGSQCSIVPLNTQGNGTIHHANQHSPSSQADVNERAPALGGGSMYGNQTEVTISSKIMAVQGYKAQSEMVIDSLDRLITSWEQKCESVIVEGVHLSLNFVIELMKKHLTIIPFMIYIAKEEKHLERFAVRAKYMTLDPAKNKYVKYIHNIRAIQDYLCKRADKHLIPRVNNTNMDQSIASIHATIFACLRRREGGEPFYDETTNTVTMVDDEYKNQCAANSLGSKGMLQVIKRRGSSRQLMALMNNDGSVAKAWPVQRVDTARRLIIPNTGGDANMGYDFKALEVSSVNLYFGNFGLSAWSYDMGGTSHSGSIDDRSSRGDGTDYQSSHRSSRYGSSRSSSPHMGEGSEKELLNKSPVSGSDEEHEEDVLDLDSEGELNDDEQEQQIEAEIEGSVGDQSIASDDEDDYMITAVQDENDKGLDSLVRVSRTILRVPPADNNGCKPHKSCEQDPSFANNGFFSSKVLGTHHDTPLQGLGKIMAEGVNRKHLHGRSKSLPVLAVLYGSPWNDFRIFRNGKRV